MLPLRDARISRRELLARGAVLGSAALALAACAPARPLAELPSSGATATSTSTSTSTQTPRFGGTLRIGRLEDIIPTAVPHLLAPANFQVDNLIYDTLVGYDQQLVARPRLATSWAWSPDFLELTLQLRPGVAFHTGRPFTSDDAKFNLERLRDPAVGSQLQGYATAMQVSAPTPGTLVINYDTPMRSSFDALSATFMADPQTIDQSATGRQFVGTGPFVFTEWLQGDHLTVHRNPNYWQTGRPYLDGLELRVFHNQQQAEIALETGAIDWMVGVAGADARRLQADPDYMVLDNSKGSFYLYLGLDVNAPGLQDKRVRQALGFAINRQRIVDSTLNGFGRSASTPWPIGSPAYDATLDASYAYDLEHARQLLADADWMATTPLPLFVSEALPSTIQMAQILQSDLASIGVPVAIQTLSQPDFVSRLTKSQFQGAWITAISWMNLSPTTFFNAAFPVRIPNSSNFVSPAYKSLIDQLSVSTDDTQQRQTTDQLTRMLLDEAFLLVIAELTMQQSGAEVVRSTVRDVVADRLSLIAYQDVWVTQ
ncbi:MAG: ABC transporter substrate-binding protein [Chloroflexi bacterium]|nr:ABC transporter substrate-binding protein [Chloroflexota bacterium]